MIATRISGVVWLTDCGGRAGRARLYCAVDSGSVVDDEAGAGTGSGGDCGDNVSGVADAAAVGAVVVAVSV